VEGTIITGASEQDVRAIVAVLTANRDDRSMFLRSDADVRANLKDFFVAKDALGEVIGCAALHAYTPTLAEILSVAVLPKFQGQGIGNQLVESCIKRASANGIKCLWLATVKPAYFARFGFKPISRWKLPAFVLWYKLRQVFQQRLQRWLPAILGTFTFMEKESESDVA
jgi:amino-acid N-acetyltransferase